MNSPESLSARFRPSVADIDLDAFRGNIRLLRSKLPNGAFFSPMIKADGYGHGSVHLSKVLREEGVRHVGVALVEEAIKLREAGDDGAILVFTPYQNASSAEEILARGLTTVISDRRQLELFSKAAARHAERSKQQVKVHLKFNTGMNRLGFAVDEAQGLREWIENHPYLCLEGVCMHLARGGNWQSLACDGDLRSADVGPIASRQQMANFSRALSAFRGLSFHVHALNSSGIVAAPATVALEHGIDPAVFGPVGGRPGIAIYGAQPTSDPGLQVPLEPVMNLKSQLVSVHRIPAGSYVSYEGTWRAERESWIGVVPFGYADGYPRVLSNRGSILCRGRRLSVAGTVCMDYFMVDLTDLIAATGEVFAGEEVVLIGHQGGSKISVDEVAHIAGTISYEILTGVSARVPRRYSKNGVIIEERHL